MGGCAAAQAAGWPALCQVMQMTSHVQAITVRVQAVGTMDPLHLVLLLVVGAVALAVAWHVFLYLAGVVFRYFPVVLAVGLVVLYMTH